MNTSREATRRRVVVIAVLLVAAAAAGFGLSQFESAASDASDGDAPAPPTVTPTQNGSGSAGGDANAGAPASTTTTTTTTSGATTTTTTTTPGSVGVQFSAESPENVENTLGEVVHLDGRLTGTLSWNVSDARTLTVVVSTWTPESEWARQRTVERAVNDTGTLALSRVLDAPVTYASGERADEFNNSNDDTTVLREGYVTVTAFVAADGATVEAQSMDSYAFSVANLATPSTPNLSVSNPGVLGVSNAAPGASGRTETVVTNDGDAAGALDVVLTGVDSAENGLIELERGVDRPGNGGELASALELRVALVRDDGARTYLVGGPDAYVTAATLDETVLAADYPLAAGESVRVVAQWRVPAATGNAIQTDSVTLNVSYVLTSTT
ncbi:hypothetical protein [Salarchaeum japonicum]|uniref:Uncharacterized protein n=1 Tax=Salarchaeum japonicum TaxID=555573 RepID=A0AAV3T178_9EURY|nr:hypothetical protein [Salarchaeum japonicum]